MTTSDLARIVFDMREAQRAYFRERTQGLLEQSKIREREVDCVIKEILEDKPAFLPGMKP